MKKNSKQLIDLKAQIIEINQKLFHLSNNDTEFQLVKGSSHLYIYFRLNRESEENKLLKQTLIEHYHKKLTKLEYQLESL